MGVLQKLRIDELCEVIRECDGCIYHVAQRMRCTSPTIRNYCKRYPVVQQAVDEARGTMGDIAESNLFSLIRERDFSATRYYLGTQCRDRGYGEHQEVEHGRPGEFRYQGNGAVPTPAELQSDEELQWLLANPYKAIEGPNGNGNGRKKH